MEPLLSRLRRGRLGSPGARYETPPPRKTSPGRVRAPAPGREQAADALLHAADLRPAVASLIDSEPLRRAPAPRGLARAVRSGALRRVRPGVLSGLQPDFDRMRQLSYFFRRSGATVVAGGSICTSFPEFATRFFDVVCAGGVDSVRGVVADYLEQDPSSRSTGKKCEKCRPGRTA